MTEILQVHITAARRHPDAHQATTQEAAVAAVADTAEVVQAVVEATVAEAVAAQAAEEDSITIKTDTQ